MASSLHLTLPCKIPHSSKRKPSTQVHTILVVWYWNISIGSIQFSQLNPHTPYTDSREKRKRKEEGKKKREQGSVSTSVSVSVSASVSHTSSSSPLQSRLDKFRQIRGRILSSTIAQQMNGQTDGQIDSGDQRWPTRCTYSLSVL